MKQYLYYLLYLIFTGLLIGCDSNPQPVREPYREKNQSPGREQISEQKTKETPGKQEDTILQGTVKEQEVQHKLVLSVLDVEFISSLPIQESFKVQTNKLLVHSTYANGTMYHVVSNESLAATLDIMEQALQFNDAPTFGENYIYPHIILKTTCIIRYKNTVEFHASLIDQSSSIIKNAVIKEGALKDLPVLIEKTVFALLNTEKNYMY